MTVEALPDQRPIYPPSAQRELTLEQQKRNQIVEENQRLVHFTIRRGTLKPTTVMDYDDMVQEGMLGLLQAAQSYDPTRGATLSRFAVLRIKGQILDAQRELNPLTKSEARNIKTVLNFQDNFIKEHGRDPSEQQISEVTGLTLEAIRQAQTNLARNQPIEASDIENFYNSGDLSKSTTFQDKNPHNSPEDSLLMKEETTSASKDLANALATLSQREREIIHLRYAEELQFCKIGTRFNLSASRIRQLHTLALVKLKRHLSADGHYQGEKSQAPVSLTDLLSGLGTNCKTFYQNNLHQGLELIARQPLTEEQQEIITRRVGEWKNRSRRNGNLLTENGKQQEKGPITLRDFLAQERISVTTYCRIIRVTGITPEGKDAGKKGRSHIILTSQEQQIIKQELETRQRKRLEKEGKRPKNRRKLELKIYQANQIRRILQVLPGLAKITPEQFINLVISGDRLIKDTIIQAIAGLPGREQRLIILRLGLDSGQPATLDQVTPHVYLTTRAGTSVLETRVLEKLSNLHRNGS